MKPILIRRLRQYAKCRNRRNVGAIDDQLNTELWNKIIIAETNCWRLVSPVWRRRNLTANNGGRVKNIFHHSPHFFHGWPRRFLLESGLPMQFTIHPMKKLEHFEQKKEYAVFCPVGEFSFEEMAHLISRAVFRCRRQKIGKLLIVSAGASGFHSAGIGEQYDYVEQIAADAASLVKIAHVASPEWVRSRDFRVMVAGNRGLELENFNAESAALEWLLQPAKMSRSADKSASPRINPI